MLVRARGRHANHGVLASGSGGGGGGGVLYKPDPLLLLSGRIIQFPPLDLLSSLTSKSLSLASLAVPLSLSLCRSLSRLIVSRRGETGLITLQGGSPLSSLRRGAIWSVTGRESSAWHSMVFDSVRLAREKRPNVIIENGLRVPAVRCGADYITTDLPAPAQKADNVPICRG